MARNASGTVRSGSSSCAVQGGTARITRSSGPSDSSPSAKVRPRHSCRLRSFRAISRRPRRISAPASRKRCSAGSTKARGQAGHRDAGTDAAAALGEGLAHHRAGKIGGAFLRRRIEGGDQHGPQEFLPQQPAARQHLVDSPAGVAPHQGRHGEIVAEPRARHAAPGDESPPRNGPVVRTQRPAHGPWRRRRTETPPGPARQPDPPRRWRGGSGRRPGCRTARGDCRCRSPCRARRHGRSGSARRPAARHPTARRDTPRPASVTAADNPANPAPTTWTRAPATGRASSEHAAACDDPQQSRLADADAPARRAPSPPPACPAAWCDRPPPSAAAPAGGRAAGRAARRSAAAK